MNNITTKNNLLLMFLDKILDCILLDLSSILTIIILTISVDLSCVKIVAAKEEKHLCDFFHD